MADEHACEEDLEGLQAQMQALLQTDAAVTIQEAVMSL